MPQLDGLRALAVSGVMFQHFFGNYYLLPRLLEVGDLGVRLFFVLSGFLITGILLQCRDGLDGANTVGGAALRFYARRALRILPVFYVVLAVATLMDLDPVRESLAWHMAYLSNFYLAKQGFWDGCVSHLWSLAVEEQFYLIWPVVVLMTPRQWLARVIGAAIVVGILSPSAALLAGANPIAATVLPNSCLDTLGMGALLALFAHDPRYAGRRRRLVMLGRNLGAPLFLLMAALHAFGIAQEVYLVGRDMAVALLGVWVIDNCARGGDSVLDRALRLPPLVYVGRISYGIYLVHLFIPDALASLAHRFGWQLPATALPRAALYTAVAIVLASLSWHLFEKPLNDLKRLFPYRRAAVVGTAAAVTEPVVADEPRA